MSKGNPIRILVVDDHPIVVEEVRILLQSYPNINVVGEAKDGADAVSKVDKFQPAVVVMDINLPAMDGIAATRVIKTKHPHIVVIGLTVRTEDYLVYSMQKAGAFEVVAKERAASDLFGTIQRAVAAAHPILIQEADLVSPNTSDPPSEWRSLHNTEAAPPAGQRAVIDPEDQP